MASHVLLRKAAPALCGANLIMENIMNTVGKLVMRIGFLSLLSVMPLAAQIDTSVDFTTSFPFYAGNTKLPAGNYRVSQLDMGSEILRIQNIDEPRSAFVDFIPTLSLQPHPKSSVSFEKYGDRDYLDRVWIAGETYGVEADRTKAEAAAAAAVNAGQHTVGGQ
ncbi:MAG: hypothetical protein QOE55_4966 [Acidobacteriaceae bacterium]|nr:hypothetical protein [Acidobacteriaceae bacterium]